MKIFALADLHLALGIPGKKMDIFGDQWIDHDKKILENCKKIVSEEDILLIPGDLSWAMRAEDAMADLNFIASLPGTKIISKGNHDYWWPSNKKLEEILPRGLFSVQNCVKTFGNFSIAGIRLWDNYEFNFDSIIDYKPNPKQNSSKKTSNVDAEKIFQKELVRLESILKELDQSKIKILLCHYPPIGVDLKESRASKLIEQYGVDYCVFGHLHNLKTFDPLFGKKGKTQYFLTSCDYLRFQPLLITQSV